MSNYKIKVNNETESREAQELFFELGYYWITGLGVKNLDAKFLYVKNNQITMGYCSDNFSDSGSDELTLSQLRDMVAAHRKPTEQDLISGADALRALADGDYVEYWCEDLKQWVFMDMQNHFKRKFRLKPRTITLSLEIPAPFEPKDGDIYYFINSSNLKGYGFNKFSNDGDDECLTFYGAWRTEDEIKQVVAALRGALK